MKETKGKISDKDTMTVLEQAIKAYWAQLKKVKEGRNDDKQVDRGWPTCGL